MFCWSLSLILMEAAATSIESRQYQKPPEVFLQGAAQRTKDDIRLYGMNESISMVVSRTEGTRVLSVLLD